MFRKGLVIGRFQPFHNGHAYLIRTSLTIAERIVIAIGSSNIHDRENPFSYKERNRMVELFLQKEGIQERIVTIFPLPDIPDDNDWLRYAREKVPEFDAVIGNNEWVKTIFLAAKIPVITIPYYKRYILEGKKIRKLMREKGEWEKRVPFYLAPAISPAYEKNTS